MPPSFWRRKTGKGQREHREQWQNWVWGSIFPEKAVILQEQSLEPKMPLLQQQRWATALDLSIEETYHQILIPDHMLWASWQAVSNADHEQLETHLQWAIFQSSTRSLLVFPDISFGQPRFTWVLSTVLTYPYTISISFGWDQKLSVMGSGLHIAGEVL